VYLRLSFCSLTYQDSQRRFTVPRSLTYATPQQQQTYMKPDTNC